MAMEPAASCSMLETDFVANPDRLSLLHALLQYVITNQMYRCERWALVIIAGLSNPATSETLSQRTAQDTRQ